MSPYCTLVLWSVLLQRTLFPFQKSQLQCETKISIITSLSQEPMKRPVPLLLINHKSLIISILTEAIMYSTIHERKCHQHWRVNPVWILITISIIYLLNSQMYLSNTAIYTKSSFFIKKELEYSHIYSSLLLIIREQWICILSW